MSSTSGISSLTDSLSSKLSARERIYLIVFAISAFGVGLYFTFEMLNSSLSITQEQIELIQTDFQEVKASEESYLTLKSRREVYEQQLKSNNLDLGKLLERVSQEFEVTIEDFKEKRRVLDDALEGKVKRTEVVVAYTQEVTIRSAKLDQLSRFLEKLEAEESPVRVTSLSWRASTQDRQELRFIKVSVTTYKSEADK